ncbi:MAG: ATP phosphoribosyltransferase [Mariprofundales bacterium]
MLKIALAKGRLLEQIVPLLAQVGMAPAPEDIKSRKLILPGPNGCEFLIIRAADVCTFVERGAADIGIVGRDLLLEACPQVYEPLDLGIGRCRLCVAAPKDLPDPMQLAAGSTLRVATKYDRLAAEFFRHRGIRAELIHLYGSMELAPLVGMADCIVDLVETGGTLRANGLIEVATIMAISSRLIVNPASYATRAAQIQPLIRQLRQLVTKGKK